MEPELKPCPFCGGKAHIEQYGTARQSTSYSCEDCGCRLETGEVFNIGDDWNRRAPDPVTADLLEALEDLHARVAGECGCSLYRDESDADFNLDQRIRRALAKAKGVG